MTESSDYESVQVFIGVDVGKDTHHAVAINRSGKRLITQRRKQTQVANI
ncbi:transposase [Escherichia coli]|nr:transposase [Escherichia coli]CAD5792682.1 transposase [Escherichia coli]